MGYERRTVLSGCAAVLAGATGGCLRLTQQTESTADAPSAEATTERDETTTRETTQSPIEQTIGEDNYEWLSVGTEFEGMTDRTGRDTATVSVGDDEIARSIDPAILVVSPGTTVVWEWTGEGGGHNIIAMDGSFSYETLTLGDGTTFEHVFSEPGVYRYYCEPHETIGGKGIIAVEE